MNTLSTDPSAPVLVLANSLCATQDMWREQMPEWSRKYRVLCFNYAGHGPQTDLSLPARDSISGMGEALMAQLDKHGVEQFDFVGLSLGGMLGLHLAARHPDRMRRLVAANCRYWFDAAGRQQWDQRIHAVREGGIAAIADGTLERWFTHEFRSGQADAVARVRQMILGTSAEGYAAAATAVRDLDLRPQLSDIRCPVLLMTGDQDVAAPAAHMQELVAALPQARLHVFERCAHLSCLEHPDDFLGQVREHLLG